MPWFHPLKKSLTTESYFLIQYSYLHICATLSSHGGTCIESLSHGASLLLIFFVFLLVSEEKSVFTSRPASTRLWDQDESQSSRPLVIERELNVG